MAGAAAARPAQAAHVVVPSATCVPHMLQNAIGVPPRLKTGAYRQRECVRDRRCGKIPEKRFGSNQQLRNTGMGLGGWSLPFGKLAHHRKLEHLSLQRLHNEHNPNQQEREADDHGNQQGEQAAEVWNEK